MPTQSEIRRRGGVRRIRTKKVRGGFVRIYVVRRRGKRGGLTLGKLHRRRG